jgi:formate dehydrogenase subunit delta
MTSGDKIAKMANQIAANLMQQDDPITATAEHMHLFWDPRMKKQLKALAGKGLSPVAADAAKRLTDLRAG